MQLISTINYASGHKAEIYESDKIFYVIKDNFGNELLWGKTSSILDAKRQSNNAVYCIVYENKFDWLFEKLNLTAARMQKEFDLEIEKNPKLDVNSVREKIYRKYNYTEESQRLQQLVNDRYQLLCKMAHLVTPFCVPEMYCLQVSYPYDYMNTPFLSAKKSFIPIVGKLYSFGIRAEIRQRKVDDVPFAYELWGNCLPYVYQSIVLRMSKKLRNLKNGTSEHNMPN
jgi:hypothetical protein